MAATQEQLNNAPRHARRNVAIALLLLMLSVAAVTATAHFANRGQPAWLGAQKDRVIAAELALFGILVVEATGVALVTLFHRAGALQTGVVVRAVLRVAIYLILVVSIVSILASNPALAIGVGSVTGVVIAFSAQNLIANAFAGMFLSIAQPFRVGEEITVSGLTGRVVDIRVMHTAIDLGDRIALVPSGSMMTQIIQRQRRSRRRYEWEQEREAEDEFEGG